MPRWPALIVAPLLVLAEQSIAFALAPLACAHQAAGWLHALAALFLLATLAIALGTTLALSREPPERRPDGRMALGMGWFSVLVLIALWLPVWGLDPCRA